MKPLKVVRVIENVDETFAINQLIYRNSGCELEQFLHELKVVQTLKKWSTWGRTYVEIPPHVLEVFGIICPSPMTIYVNYVYNNPHFFLYMGSVFSRDAAWFDEYYLIEDFEKIKMTKSFQLAKEACEGIDIDKNKQIFLDYFDSPQTKWKKVEVHNPAPIDPQGKDAVIEIKYTAKE